MERSSEEGVGPDEEDGDQAVSWIMRPGRSEDEGVEVTPASKTASRGGGPELSRDILALSLKEGFVYEDQEESKRQTGENILRGVMSEGGGDAPTVSPSSLMDTCASSISSLSSYSSTHHHDNFSSSSSSCSLSLTPPLPPSVELSAVLTDTRLTLDVYQGGAAALPLLWGSIPGQLMGLQYLRLGSENKPGLDGALEVLPHLTELHSVAIRGHCFYDSQGDPLPGLLTTLPTSVSCLSLLVHMDLSFNQLSCLPPCLLSLPVLSSLLLCHNRLSALPPDIGQLSTLTYLSLLGNQLVSLPPSLGSLLSLRELVIYSNDLRLIPQCLNKLPQLKIDVRDNPLGQPPTPPPIPPPPDQAETNIPELHLGFNQHRYNVALSVEMFAKSLTYKVSLIRLRLKILLLPLSFCVSPAGCHVFLPGGAELLFPPGCLVTTTRLEWVERRPEKKLVWLEEHDILLSRPLELRPHGITFLMPVEVCVPYHRKKRREVVVRRFDGQSWGTLSTVLRRGSECNSSHPGGRPARLACCSVSQFSWFMAVSRPVKDSCSVTPAGALLVSSSDPGIKLHFPPDSTVETRAITLQVLQVSVSEVQALCGDPQVSVSPLLCLSQTPSIHFLQPVKVQVPLPSGVTGHTVDMSCLHLLHGDPAAQTWTDITSQVSLHVTHLYAIFYITHFSWYWLWYTTQRCVSGVVRKVYQKLKQFKVQFFVLQRKTDPSQVLLQCLPANKVCYSPLLCSNITVY
ncbi:hypothetical protein PAMP_019829 [Pampus punctatissimus]